MTRNKIANATHMRDLRAALTAAGWGEVDVNDIIDEVAEQVGSKVTLDGIQAALSVSLSDEHPQHVVDLMMHMYNARFDRLVDSI